jgi:Cd2+/Zn2+-exporting ATPase
MATAVLKVLGMDCAEEVTLLRDALLPVPGVRDLAFDLLNGKLTVDYDDARLRVDGLLQAIARAGLKAHPWQDQQAEPAGWSRWGRMTMTAASGAFLVCGAATHVALSGWGAIVGAQEELALPLLPRLFYAGAIVAGAWFVAPKAWRALTQLRPDMNLLMTVAVAGAVLIGEYLEAGAVAFLFAFSNALEAWTVGRARRAIAALLALAPAKAHVLRLGKMIDGSAIDSPPGEMDVAAVPIGSLVLVKPGQKFPLDGRITKGETTVNQAPITGESSPVPKAINSEVFAGTVNEDGTVEFQTTKVASDTTVAQIVRLVGEAQSKRSPSEQWVETFSRYYTPAVMAFALAVIVLPPLIWDGAWMKWFYEGLVLLVIACPCALVISTPVSIVAALTSAARQGVLIKGGLYIETPAKLKAIALDKTGTLTEGRPTVKEVIPFSGHTEAELIRIAAAIEARSEHPLARAVTSYAKSAGVEFQPVEDFQVLKGKGATAVLDGKLVWIGSHRYLEERVQETAEMHNQLVAWSETGASAIVIGNDDHVCGLIAVTDRIRADAAHSVAQLKAVGIEHVIVLTGDNRGTAEAVGKEAGVDEVRSELLPEDKVAAMEDLVARYQYVAMVGDGVNDAPAMARATLGIAMGIAGTDVAIETADVALMSDDLSRIAWLIGHSRRTLAIIRQNIFASLSVKFIFVVLTLLGHGSLWAAIAADTGMSIAVVFNALRLLRPGS